MARMTTHSAARTGHLSRWQVVEFRQPTHSAWMLTDTQAEPLPSLDTTPAGPDQLHIGRTAFKPAPQRARPAGPQTPLSLWCAVNPRVRWPLVAAALLLLWGLAGAIGT